MKRLFDYIGRKLENYLYTYEGVSVVVSRYSHYEWINTYDVKNVTLYRLAHFLQADSYLAITQLKFWQTFKYVFFSKDTSLDLIKWYLRLFITVQGTRIELYRNDGTQVTYYSPY